MGMNNMKEAVSFELNAVESERLRGFCNEHRTHARHVSAGEMVRVILTPTLPGTLCEVQCLSCGKVENLTDFEAW